MDAKAFIALTGNDETNLMACLRAQEFGASLATVSNIGPGPAGVGPTENFAFFAVLALLVPRFWRR
ncbi:MAG: hypothetical protein CL933_22620 [Deltaproteobacteria bacterium]|nr:hypothetical protein [Deltaproteobacteria bacterium]